MLLWELGITGFEPEGLKALKPVKLFEPQVLLFWQLLFSRLLGGT